MKKTDQDSSQLRQKAEAQLAHSQDVKQMLRPAEKLLLELHAHQIELERQNEELRQARTEADALLARYTELYDFAPIGYFTLNHDSMIRQVNLTGAKMLGVERGKLDKRRLASFVAENDRLVFSKFLDRVFAGQTREACDLTLMSTGNMPRLMHIEADADETGKTCRAAVTDITESHAAQQQLALQLRQIENAKLEWESVFDSVLDPIFLHDKEFRILRCNKAYQRCAGVPFKQIIGQLYYEIFPKTGAPLPCCLRAMEKAEGEGEEGEVAAGEALYRSRTFSIRDEQGVYLYSVHALEDITESHRIEAELHDSEEKFRKISESAQDAIIMMGADQNISFWNAAAERIFGYTAAEALGQELLALVAPEPAHNRFTQAFPHFQASGKGPLIDKVTEVIALRKGGEEFPAELSISAAQLNGQWHAITIVRDITERKQTETALRERNTLIETLLENAPIGFAMNSMDDGRMTFVSRRFAEIYGVPPGTPERLTDFFEKVYRDPVFREQIRTRVMADISSGDATRMHWEDVPLITASGEKKFISASNIPLPEQNLMISAVWDVTDRYKASADLREKEQNYRTLADSAPALIWTSGTDKLCDYFNQPWLNFTGRTLEQELGNGWAEGVHLDDIALCVATYTESFDRREPFSMDYRLRRHDGKYRWMREDGCPRHDSDGNFTGYIGYLMDITERKQAEAATEHANRALATLSAVNRSLVHASSEDELLQSICQSIVEQRGYLMAWVGYKQHDANKSIKVMAHAGHDEGYLDALQLIWAETAHGVGLAGRDMEPAGRAVRSGTPQLCQDISSDPLFLPWREAALQRGYMACIALPLANGEVFGVLLVYTGETNAFTPAEIYLLEEMAGDLAFGVHTLHVREERDLTLIKNQEQLVQLQDSMEDTMRAIAGIVEMRDPYTAGHQQRVAQLAAAIAVEMGLPEEQAHAIHLAGIVHDLGKIQVPAEILSKPGRITDLEFGLIKIHPQAGYDILKGIDFPWPIAQMVLQHHERFDGSGYPQGLKGDDILLEARILAVADVVEAISAHRPYRPGLGIEVALEEITKNCGKFYDPQAVDTCVRLFGEKGFAFGQGH